MPNLLIITVFFFAFFGNTLVKLNIIPYQVTLLTELSIYLLFLISLVSIAKNKKSYRIDFLPLLIIFVVIACCSAIANHILNVAIVVSLRNILRFYIFYFALINLGLKSKDIILLNKVVFVIFVLQIVAVSYNFSIYGIHERCIGTYDISSEGKTAFMIPIIGIGYVAGYYFLYKKNIVYLLLILGYLFFALASAKKAHFIMMPVTFLGLYYLIFLRKKKISFRNISMVVIVLLVSICASAVVMMVIPNLNPERKVGGSLDLKHVFEYSQKYTEGTKADSRYAGGRLSTAKLAFKTAWANGVGNFFIGHGPGTMSTSALNKKFDPRVEFVGGSYGNTGVTLLLMEYGLLAVLIFFMIFTVFIYRCLEWCGSENDPYWKAFAVGSVVFASLNMFCYLFYSTVPITGDVIEPVFLYAMAIMYRRTILLES